MVHFNELKITTDSKYLIIDVVIRNEWWFDNVYLDEIVIDNQDTFVDTGMPSSNPIYTHKIKPTKKNGTQANNIKHIRLELTTLELRRPLTDLFFVYVKTKGTPATSIDDPLPCYLQKSYTMGTVFNMYPIYQVAINYLKTLGNCCNVPKDFIDLMLKVKAMELSVKTGNFIEAIKFFNYFFRGGFHSVQLKGGGCSCGGTI